MSSSWKLMSPVYKWTGWTTTTQSRLLSSKWSTMSINNGSSSSFFSTLTSSNTIYKFWLFWLLLGSYTIQNTKAGYCWSSMSANNRCVALSKSGVSREDCCSDGQASTAYSPKELKSGDLFFYRALQGGVPCQPCKNSCKDVQCSPGKVCILRQPGHRPVCACDSSCSSVKRKAGKVCGTDGRTYRNVCKLNKRKCRKDSNLAVAYSGPCQRSCKSVSCPEMKTCILDQNRTPHCVSCTQRCRQRNGLHIESKMVCGVDNQTYPTACHLRQTACLKGKAIQIAYRGKCKANATCETIKCQRGKKCLIDHSNANQPRCSTCPMPCFTDEATLDDQDDRISSRDQKRKKIFMLMAMSRSGRQVKGNSMDVFGNKSPVCGSNNRTYSSWCEMMQDSCSLGFVLHTQSIDLCQNIVSVEPESGRSDDGQPSSGQQDQTLDTENNVLCKSRTFSSTVPSTIET